MIGEFGCSYGYCMVLVLRLGVVLGLIEGSELWVYSAQYTE